jgi:hypothetical protein
MGRRVRAVQAKGTAGLNELALAAGDLAPGCYVVVLTAGNARARTTFVVTR